jgi:uncharacterized membrane protein YGL010W
MAILERIALKTKAFVVDYIQRHAHPVNASLHILGVPMAFWGIFKLTCGRFPAGVSFIVMGYILQYLGHKAQGNEVGEVTLIKSVWRKLNKNEEIAP